MSRNKLFRLIFLLTLFGTSVVAQTTTNTFSSKNAIYISLGTVFTYSSFNINYDYKIIKPDNSFF